ncbi:MAG: hypothetical protein KDK70_21150 [Myxococcales bacterium]|nr:hypothetical protein [Myxococcales bacterium]
MTASAPRGYVEHAAAWDADAGPPAAELLPRAERSAASFETRILAQVLGELAPRALAPLPSLPWVLGLGDETAASRLPGAALRRALAPRSGLSLVYAGAATVPMALLEGLAHLVDHPAVLVAFAADAAPPHHEALAAALLLTREPTGRARLVLTTPTLRRTSSHSERRTTHEHPLMPALVLARAINVGQPTVHTVPPCAPDRREHWQIELRTAF